MASANLELVRSIYAAWEGGDYTAVEWAHPDIEVVFADGPTPGRWTGLTGLTQGWRNFLDVWEGLRVEVDEVIELDAERVLVLAYFSGRGKASGLELRQLRAKGAALYHLRDGKATRQVFWWDRERALAELGLAPEDETRASSE